MLEKIKQNYHKQVYQKNKDGAFKILVSLDKYEDIYSDWDPAPFRKRDIEDDFVEYIWDSAIDIPLKEDIKIVFLMDEKVRNEPKETQLVKALNNHFTYSLHKSERLYFNEMRHMKKHARSIPITCAL